ncbi:MAG TPA: class I SAM-dependent methyltransferase [Gemmatimonadaceae bacterium]|nr:class I SAM-dependent methyltransferase [Gemmatimonadaceae bacterium]
MIWALTNDVMQRLATFNKRRQKQRLSALLSELDLPRGSRVLDFGCGTALFGQVFCDHGLEYCGYDIDLRLMNYAARLYPDFHFLTKRGDLTRMGPYALIVANCCYHHIHDEQLELETTQIHALLADNGTFLLIDLVAGADTISFLKRAYLRVEQGVKIRTSADYRRLLEPLFVIDLEETSAQPLWLLERSPLHQDLIVFRCRKAPSGNASA